MLSRRLILAPVIALGAMVLVGAIIDSGERARMARADGLTQLSVPADPALATEARRVRQAATAAERCSGTAACTAEVTSARVRDAAHEIDRWPADRRFQLVRATLRTQLLTQAALIEQRTASDVDGRSTYATRARLRDLEHQLDDATLDAARAQRSAGLLSRAAFDALVEDLT
ncbi:MAG: hypothetical protein JWL76_1672 [Thermoleophilia bacterium]|nr:hypothetical protein [Thermoleophilia bacterium]